MNELTAMHESTGLLKMDHGEVVVQPEAATKIADFLKFVKMLKAEEDNLKKMMFEEMEQFGISLIGTDEFTACYMPETDRIELDTKALKIDCPDIFDAYSKVSKVKAHVRIRLR